MFRSDQRKGKMKPPPNPLLQPKGGGYFDPDDHLDDDLDDDLPPFKPKNNKSFSPSPQHQSLWKNSQGHLILYPGEESNHCKFTNKLPNIALHSNVVGLLT